MGKGGSTVLVDITDPQSNSVWAEVVTVTSDNSYELSLEAGEEQYDDFSEHRMEATGSYLVTASYFNGDEYLIVDTNFRFEG